MLVHKIQQAQVQIQLLPPLSLNKLLNLLPKSLKCQQCMPSWKSCFRIWNKGLAKSQHLINGNSLLFYYYWWDTDKPLCWFRGCGYHIETGMRASGVSWGMHIYAKLGKMSRIWKCGKGLFFFLTLFSLLLQTGTHFALLFFAVYESNHDVTED